MYNVIFNDIAILLAKINSSYYKVVTRNENKWVTAERYVAIFLKTSGSQYFFHTIPDTTA